MSVELYKKHRPQSLSDVVGQASAVEQLERMVDSDKLPHSILFTGPSGTGKTTLARILKKELRCSDPDFFELNSADFRGIDTIRAIGTQVGSSPIGGKCRIWLIDEMHQLTTAAQEAFLKLLEDTPDHVYFFLCTTERDKLKKAIITRCTEIRLNALSEEEIKQLLRDISKKENIKVHKDVVPELLQAAEGSARKAVVLLHQLMGCESLEEQKAVIERETDATKAIDLCRMLMGSPKWNALCDAIKSYEDSSMGDVEKLRWAVLGYAKACMKNPKSAKRAYSVISAFRDPFYDSKFAGVYAACWEILQE